MPPCVGVGNSIQYYVDEQGKAAGGITKHTQILRTLMPYISAVATLGA